MYNTCFSLSALVQQRNQAAFLRESLLVQEAAEKQALKEESSVFLDFTSECILPLKPASSPYASHQTP